MDEVDVGADDCEGGTAASTTGDGEAAALEDAGAGAGAGAELPDPKAALTT